MYSPKDGMKEYKRERSLNRNPKCREKEYMPNAQKVSFSRNTISCRRGYDECRTSLQIKNENKLVLY